MFVAVTLIDADEISLNAVNVTFPVPGRKLQFAGAVNINVNPAPVVKAFLLAAFTSSITILDKLE